MDKELFNELRDKVAETAKTALKKSNELVEITKVNLSILDQQGKINGAYKEVGKMVYDAHSSHDSAIDSINDKLTEIDEMFIQLEKLREKLAELKKVKLCPACKKENAVDASFCSSCGNTLDIEE